MTQHIKLEHHADSCNSKKKGRNENKDIQRPQTLEQQQQLADNLAVVSPSSKVLVGQGLLPTILLLS